VSRALLASLSNMAEAYLVVRLDVQLDLFAGEGADSGWIGQLVALFMLGERVVRGGIYLICMVGEVGGCCCGCV